MIHPRLSVYLLFLLFAAINPVAAQVSEPAARVSTLALADLFTRTNPEEIGRMFIDPVDIFFHPQPPPGAEDTRRTDVATVARPARETTLSDLADIIRPTGTVEISGILHLIFGERRVSQGSFLAVEHNGVTHQVKLLRVGSRHYVLQWNQRTIERTIQ